MKTFWDERIRPDLLMRQFILITSWSHSETDKFDLSVFHLQFSDVVSTNHAVFSSLVIIPTRFLSFCLLFGVDHLSLYIKPKGFNRSARWCDDSPVEIVADRLAQPTDSNNENEIRRDPTTLSLLSMLRRCPSRCGTTEQFVVTRLDFGGALQGYQWRRSSSPFSSRRSGKHAILSYISVSLSLLSPSLDSINTFTCMAITTSLAPLRTFYPCE